MCWDLKVSSLLFCYNFFLSDLIVFWKGLFPYKGFPPQHQQQWKHLSWYSQRTVEPCSYNIQGIIISSIMLSFVSLWTWDVVLKLYSTIILMLDLHYSFIFVALMTLDLHNCFKTEYLSLVGSSVHLFTVDWSKPWWSPGAWNCSHVQDRQIQVWNHCSVLDPEICHGLGFHICRRNKIVYGPISK
jgi:hypothetical protein